MKSGLLVCALFVGSMLTASAMAAEVAAAASGAAVRASQVTNKANLAVGAKTPVATGKVATQTGGVIGKAGDNQYPTGAPVIPPKPKKEGLEAAGAIKAKAAQP